MTTVFGPPAAACILAFFMVFQLSVRLCHSIPLPLLCEQAYEQTRQQTDRDAQQRSVQTLSDMKEIVFIFLHVFRSRYPHLLLMAEPTAVDDKGVIPGDEQPDDGGIPETFKKGHGTVQIS